MCVNAVLIHEGEEFSLRQSSSYKNCNTLAGEVYYLLY